ncbi:MAG: polysulfide reductase [Candidatus Glassbacteria bacterium]|nr:polysulfide reductase [Candidatus Glassbacteria bacterium]
MLEQLERNLSQIVGYIYPNEIELHWGILIVVYPYITGLVAGAFILASLERVFNVKEIMPTYRLSLLTALSFLLIAPLPLLLHLGHPERFYEIMITPHLESAMAMFGFVYIWYLMMVLILEIWFEYRQDLVVLAREGSGLKKYFYYLLTLGSLDLSEKSLRFDKKAVGFITILGIPSAFILHGYVGFLFGSIKANPWWSSVLMPIVFLFSAIVSGIALMVLVYGISTLLRGKSINMPCMDKLATYLLNALIIDLSLETLDFIHRVYESVESIHIMGQMISQKLFISLIVVQLMLGTLLPIVLIVVTKTFSVPAELRRLVYFMAAIFVQIGIFSTRWNVVIGGQLFSKSLRGLTNYKMELLGVEGLLISIGLLVLPVIILIVMIKILPPWKEHIGAAS